MLLAAFLIWFRMASRSRVDLHVEWLSTVEGGRRHPIWLRPEGEGGYRPHLRLGPDGDYLGVQFLDGDPPMLPPGGAGHATAELMYESRGVDYRALVPGAEFDVMEGKRRVGRGRVLRRHGATQGER